MISIAIPSFTGDDLVGLGHLDILFKTIELQDYKDVEIVVSDHSLNNYIEIFCKSKSLNIKYLKNDNDEPKIISSLKIE